jgi:hypothetical protein
MMRPLIASDELQSAGLSTTRLRSMQPPPRGAFGRGRLMSAQAAPL